MTRMQERRVKQFKRDAETCLPGVELKQFEVHENEYFVAVIAEVGTPGDEGTLAEAFCRYHAQVFIGKRGGMRYPMNRILKSGKFRYYEKAHSNFFSTAIDQRVH